MNKAGRNTSQWYILFSAVGKRRKCLWSLFYKSLILLHLISLCLLIFFHFHLLSVIPPFLSPSSYYSSPSFIFQVYVSSSNQASLLIFVFPEVLHLSFSHAISFFCVTFFLPCCSQLDPGFSSWEFWFYFFVQKLDWDYDFIHF